MKERLREYALIEEIVSAVAILVSLLLVGMEIRRNTEASKAWTYQSLIELSHDRLKAMAENREFAELDMRDLGDLDSVDRYRRELWDRDGWRIRENAFVQYARGVIGDGEWTGFRSLMCGGDLDSSWPNHRGQLSPEFVEFIEDCNNSN